MIISIITVTYNARADLDRTIQSVLEQEFADIEYIIVDGGSTDGSLDIIKDMESKEVGEHNKITFKWVSEPDNGIYDAMNKGLMMASGDYVWFLNAGDTLHLTNSVKCFTTLCNKYKMPDIIYGETDLTDGEGRIFAHRRLRAPDKLRWKSFGMGMLVSHQAFVVKRSLAEEYDLSYRYSADFDWCIRCMKKAKTIVNSRLRIVNYKYEGTTTANRSASLKERYKIMCRYYGLIPTILRHLWFAVRFYWAKIFGKVI
ncbi:MAG: glycosyltransferase [Tannerella sp.]|jgi:glycosyltransferase involved in cell wall biosynthesis|nr:glycosyltransferase [Tannerella sp.]